jgi:elongation factor G
LRLPAAAVQIPIGLESELEGVVDIIERKAIYFLGEKGQEVVRKEVPENLKAQCEEKRREMIEKLADVDDIIAEKFLLEEEPTVEEIRAAIRRQTIARKFVPVHMGSAYKNKGVQALLDGVNNYLPSPDEKENVALDLNNNEAEVPVVCSPTAPFVALAFKLEESRYGQLTYLRIYQGTLRKGDTVVNMKVGLRLVQGIVMLRY